MSPLSSRRQCTVAYSALSQMACSLSPTFEVTTEPMTRTGRWAAADDTYCTTAWPNGTEQHLYETAAAAGNKYKSNMNLLSRIWRVRSADGYCDYQDSTIPMDWGRSVAAGKNYEQHVKRSAEALHLSVLVWRWLKDKSGNCKQARDNGIWTNSVKLHRHNLADLIWTTQTPAHILLLQLVVQTM